MIIVRLVGGLGNQMFQYAAARSLALRVGTEVLIDASLLSLDDLRKCQLDAYTIGARVAGAHGPPHRFVRAIRRLRGPRCEYRNFDLRLDHKFFSLSDGTAISGWFQSPLYFAGIEEDIRSQFTLRLPSSAEAMVVQSAIDTEHNAVSIHVRRGDYANAGTSSVHGLVDIEYYRRAMAVVRGLIGRDPHYFLFSDEPEWVRDNLTGLGDCTVVAGQRDAPWEDLALMSRCRQHIIAN